MRILYYDQLNAVEKLRKYKVGSLFMEAGTGKTTVACELIRSVSDIDFILWLVLCQIKENLNNGLNKIRLENFHIVGIESMSNFVIKLLNLGMSDIEICQNLGMEAEELIRLKQQIGIAAAYKNHAFSNSWEIEN